jgi:thymidine phosphorylase
MNQTNSWDTFKLKAHRIGIDTHKHVVVYMQIDNPICRSAGFRSETKVKIRRNSTWVIATLYVITSDILNKDEIGFSESAWEKMGIEEGSEVIVSHAEALDSFRFIRAKLFGKSFTESSFKEVMDDMVEGYYSDVQLSSFVTACVDLTRKETIYLTQAMSKSGRQIKWDHDHIVDKHCVGGLPGNRTSMIVVPILAAHGLTIPKTSSRAITSPSGTADTMEVIAPVNLTVDQMKKVVNKEGGCIVWGGSVDLSPVDDVLVQIERALDLDSNKQLVASVLSKKIAAGSTDIIIDMPIGPTAKVRTKKAAKNLSSLFKTVGDAMDLNIRIVMTDGSQPVGRGIGPVLEARDVLSVLRGEKNAPQDLKERSIFLASKLMELCCPYSHDEALQKAAAILDDGRALKKFEAICEAQGGMREPELSDLKYVITAKHAGLVTNIDNRLIARVAKFAGAPDTPAAGVDLHTPLGVVVEKNQPLFTVYASSKGELENALHYYDSHQDVIQLGEIAL